MYFFIFVIIRINMCETRKKAILKICSYFKCVINGNDILDLNMFKNRKGQHILRYNNIFLFIFIIYSEDDKKN